MSNLSVGSSGWEGDDEWEPSSPGSTMTLDSDTLVGSGSDNSVSWSGESYTLVETDSSGTMIDFGPDFSSTSGEDELDSPMSSVEDEWPGPYPSETELWLASSELHYYYSGPLPRAVHALSDSIHDLETSRRAFYDLRHTRPESWSHRAVLAVAEVWTVSTSLAAELFIEMILLPRARREIDKDGNLPAILTASLALCASRWPTLFVQEVASEFHYQSSDDNHAAAARIIAAAIEAAPFPLPSDVDAAIVQLQRDVKKLDDEARSPDRRLTRQLRPVMQALQQKRQGEVLPEAVLESVLQFLLDCDMQLFGSPTSLVLYNYAKEFIIAHRGVGGEESETIWRVRCAYWGFV